MSDILKIFNTDHELVVNSGQLDLNCCYYTQNNTGVFRGYLFQMSEHSPLGKEQIITCCLHFLPIIKGIHSSKRHCMDLNEMQKKNWYAKKCLVLSMSFSFLYLNALKSGPWWLQRDCKPTNPEPTPPTTSSLFPHSEQLLPCPNHTRAGYQTSLELFESDNAKPVYPSSLVSFCRNHKSRLLPTFPTTPSASDLPHASLCDPHDGVCPFLSGSVSIINFCFHGSHLLIYWPCHT